VKGTTTKKKCERQGRPRSKIGSVEFLEWEEAWERWYNIDTKKRK